MANSNRILINLIWEKFVVDYLTREIIISYLLIFSELFVIKLYLGTDEKINAKMWSRFLDASYS